MKKLFLIYMILITSITFAGEYSVYEANYPNVKDYNVNIHDATIKVVPRGNFIEMNLYMTISYDFNSWFFKNYNELEFLWKFSLPENAIMTDYKLWITEDSTVSATVMDKWTAELMFSDVSTPIRHPGLLTQSEATRDGKVNYELKIFPVKRSEKRKFKIQYLVPGRPSANSLRAWLPITQIIAEKTINNVNKVNIKYEYNRNSAEPRVVGAEVLNKEQSITDSTWSLQIPVLYDQFVEFVIPSPIEDHAYLSSYKYNDENYYHLAVYPPKTPKIKEDRKVLVCVDLNIYNTKNFDGEYLITYLKETIAQAMDENDSINVMIAYDDIVVGSENWISCSEENLDWLFTKVMKRSFPTYSYFQPLMSKAAEFINKSSGNPEVVVFSNTDEINLGVSDKEALAGEILDMFTKNSKLHFVDLDNVNGLVYNYSNGNGYYETQLQSFYGKMSYETAGNLYYLRYHDIKTILNAFFYEKISHFESVEVQMTFQNGYSFSKHLMNQNEGYYPLDFPIMQAGKFIGDFPITVKIIGKKQMEIVDTTFIITESDLKEGDQKIATSWYGENIRGLLDYSYDPLTISSIVDMSIEQKILTPYTGFIVIDKSLTNYNNKEDEGDDDSGGEDYDEGNDGNTTSVEEDSTTTADIEFSAYPNPFNSTVTLKVYIPEFADYSLIIYNILGQKVKEFDLSSMPKGINYIRWHGDTDDNLKVSSGLYFAVIHGKNFTKSIKLHLVE
ncbi:MAG: T9SS type A sorting domain-containing protein [Melioribacteraceae bacterium]|nr:T9SS type A sorting domain-containing protein [Melioribacteraceae bacterium]